MRRFTIEVLVISVAAAVLWGLTREYTAVTTIAGAKWLHRLVGYPAPFLLAEGNHDYWFSPLFPPLVGLVLASRWVPWRRRLLGLGIGLCAFWYVVSVQVAVTYSPYLTLSTVRAYLMQTQIAMNSVVMPVLLWLAATGGPGREQLGGARTRGQAATGARQGDLAPGTGGLNPLVSAALAVVLCVAVSFPVKLAAEQSGPSLDLARKRVANAILAKDFRGASRGIDDMLSMQGGDNRYLSHLQRELQRLADQTASGR